MKKTIIALMALAGVAMADTLTLTSYDVKFGDKTSLTSSNVAMTWGDASKYTNWYMEFSLEGIKKSNQTTLYQWQDTICTGSGDARNGLAVLAKYEENEWRLSFGKGNRTHIDSSLILTFDPDATEEQILTFAVYDGVAYIGNKATEEYISVALQGVNFGTGYDATMTSGSNRAFANAETTPISKTTIASLDNLAIPTGQKLDIVKLVTTGAAVTIPEPATATLSLLALAGLAMRRRRK